MEWYAQNRRNLPWRNETDPYKIWVSEIILQQTRVAQGWKYYLQFIKKFPNVNALATAREEEVLQIWQGLGYYSRARNMHFAAQQIAQNHHNIFPNTYNEILKLKGVGRYTAAAIASIAFQISVAAVDGNVLRVMSRFYGIVENIAAPQTYKTIENLCTKWIQYAPAGDFNQAMMELGATCCTPKKPNCLNCPLQYQCYAYIHEKTEVLPLKINNIKQKDRFFHFFIFTQNNQILLEQRTHNDIWKKLFQYPLLETSHACTMPQIENLQHLPTSQWKEIQFFQEINHQLTHQRLHIRFYKVIDFEITNIKNYFWADIENLHNYSLPTPLQKIWNNL